MPSNHFIQSIQIVLERGLLKLAQFTFSPLRHGTSSYNSTLHPIFAALTLHFRLEGGRLAARGLNIAPFSFNSIYRPDRLHAVAASKIK